MRDIRLPDALRAGIETFAARQGRAGTRRAIGLSDAYRQSRPSAAVVVDDGDVAAYLVSRMPATYAAVARVLREVGLRVPGFEPRSAFDAGAGPGTASWAAVEAFPTLDAITMLDHNPRLLAAAGDLAAAGPEALRKAERIAGTLRSPPVGSRGFDLVMAAYCLTEVPDAGVVDAALALWARCQGALVVVEPGRTRDYQRLMQVRAALLAAGAEIVAPCPHANPCPLPADDWCHFSIRVQRSRAHMQSKGGTLGYEDEKFSYLVVARAGIVARAARARIVRPPTIRKFEAALPVCGIAGIETVIVPKRDALAFKAARKLEWGDTVE